MDKAQLTELAERYLSGAATEKEIALLHEWYDTADTEEIELVFAQGQAEEEEIGNRMFTDLQTTIQAAEVAPPPRIVRLRPWLAAASIILALVLTGVYVWRRQQPSPKTACCTVPQIAAKTEIQPGTNRASLRLGNGSVIDLMAAKNGTLTQVAGARIDKQDGQLTYDASKHEDAVEMNTIQTPRGGEYQIVLADGTKVWLNSASSLSYPTAFTGKDRQVQLNGEAYFEVAQNKSQPFKVVVGNTQVDVLGTHFDIMAYDDEQSINTTVLEGSVRVAAGTMSKVLHPGQQASSGKSTQSVTLQEVDADEAIAWKNGYFQFSGVPIETVARQLSRWYDVDVDFEGKTAEHFRGKISRNANVSEVFRMLELTGAVHYRIDGKKIIVTP